MICDLCGADRARICRVVETVGKGPDLLVIENVPRVICTQCGESYFTADTLHELERIHLHRQSFAAERAVQVAQFAVEPALGLLAAGRTVEQVAQSYDLPVEAVQEALKLAARALTLTAETLEELTAAYMELPWLDEMRLSQGHGYAVTIIPSDDVSMDEKLLLTFVDASPKAHRVPALLQEIAATLGCEQPITAIVHAGGARYTFLLADGCSLSIPTHEMSVETYLRVLFLLKELSVTAQILFVASTR